MTEQIARSTSMALVPFLDLLVASKSTKIGLRATLHQDNVSYIVYFLLLYFIKHCMKHSIFKSFHEPEFL